MGTISVFDKEKWKPSLSAKLLTVPVLELSLSYPDDKIAPMPQKQRTVYDKKFKENFDGKFKAMTAARGKQIQDAIDWTEERIKLKKDKAEMEEVVATSNKLLKQGFDVWQAEIEKLCNEAIEKAYEASVKDMKMKLIKAQIKSAAKIVVLSALILTAAALAIAASVATGGALAPLILGAIATGAGALYKAYKVYDTQWASAGNKIKEIQEDMKKLQSAIDAYKKSESYGGKFDKAKAFKATLGAPVSDIEKHVGQLDKYIFDLQKTLTEQQAKLLELGKKALEANSSEVDAAIKACNVNINKAKDQLKAINDCKAAAATVKSEYKATKIPDYGKLNSVVSFLSSSSDNVSQIGSSMKTAFSMLKKVGVAVPAL